MNKMFLLARLVTTGISVYLMTAVNALAKDDRSTLYTQVQMDNKWSYYSSKSKAPLTGHFPFMKCFQEASEKNKLPKSLLMAVARGESNFDKNAVSKASAIGVMQIRWPITAKHLGISKKSDLRVPCININAGARYLKELLARYNNIYFALAAYNYGPSRITKAMKVNQLPDGAHWYASYIYDHLQYILSSNNVDYENYKQRVIISFSKAYRAKSFTDYLNQGSSELQIEWFKRPSHRYDVVLSFEEQLQLEKGEALLRKYGFDLAELNN